LEGVHILVVDDEEDARELLVALLSQCKVRISTAGSAAEALQIVKEARPHIVVSDIGMPGEDGYELVRQLRRFPLRQEEERQP
jgi:CheY-like chemotaxis protein